MVIRYAIVELCSFVKFDSAARVECVLIVEQRCTYGRGSRMQDIGQHSRFNVIITIMLVRTVSPPSCIVISIILHMSVLFAETHQVSLAVP